MEPRVEGLENEGMLSCYCCFESIYSLETRRNVFLLL